MRVVMADSQNKLRHAWASRLHIVEKTYSEKEEE